MNKYAIVGVVLATHLMHGSDMKEWSKVLKDGQELHTEAAGQVLFGGAVVAAVRRVNRLPSRIASKVPGFIATSTKNISRKLPKKTLAVFVAGEIGAHLWQSGKFKDVEEQLYEPRLTFEYKEKLFKDTEASYPIAFEHRDVKLKSKIMINSNASNKLLFPFFLMKPFLFSKFAANQTK